jgi:hypothetical protein
MDITPALVDRERELAREAADTVVPLINRVRDDLGDRFDTAVDPVAHSAYGRAVDETFDDGDRGANAAALAALLRDLDAPDDHPGFVVDELLGRELAATVAGEQPLRLLAEATFHYADTVHHSKAGAGVDDYEAALAAGFQTRLPGWPWRDASGPFD